MVIFPYDTESKSRNVLAPPLGEEGHEVAKGWTVVILIMILDVDVTAEGGIIKLIARRAMSIIMPPFGGHVHIECHNHSYHRPPLRHFVALFP